MKNLLIGMLILPAILGALVVSHTMILKKKTIHGDELTNRIVRLELVWLAMNKPQNFIEYMPALLQNIGERNQLRERVLLNSPAYDEEYFLANNPDVAKVLGNNPDLLKQYWLANLDECLDASPQFHAGKYLKQNPILDTKHHHGSCASATYGWVEWDWKDGPIKYRKHL